MPSQQRSQSSGQQWPGSQPPLTRGQPADKPASAQKPPKPSAQTAARPLRGPRAGSQASKFASYPVSKPTSRGQAQTQAQSNAQTQIQPQKSLNPGEVRNAYANEFIEMLEAGAEVSELENKLPSGEDWKIVNDNGDTGEIYWKYKAEKVECRFKKPGQDLERVLKRGGDIPATKVPRSSPRPSSGSGPRSGSGADDSRRDSSSDWENDQTQAALLIAKRVQDRIKNMLSLQKRMQKRMEGMPNSQNFLNTSNTPTNDLNKQIQELVRGITNQTKGFTSGNNVGNNFTQDLNRQIQDLMRGHKGVVINTGNGINRGYKKRSDPMERMERMERKMEEMEEKFKRI